MSWKYWCCPVKQQEKKTANCVTTWHQHNVLNIIMFCFYIQFQMLNPHWNKILLWYLCKQSECWKVCLVLSEHRSADVHMKQTDNKKDRPMDLQVKLFTVHLWINLSVLNASCMWVLYHVKHTCKHSAHHFTESLAGVRADSDTFWLSTLHPDVIMSSQNSKAYDVWPTTKEIKRAWKKT